MLYLFKELDKQLELGSPGILPIKSGDYLDWCNQLLISASFFVKCKYKHSYVGLHSTLSSQFRNHFLHLIYFNALDTSPGCRIG